MKILNFSPNTQNKKRRRSKRIEETKKNINNIRLCKKPKTVEINNLEMLLASESLSNPSTKANEYFKLMFEKGILEKVLERLESRRNAAQVNKMFYKAACDADNKQDIYKLKIDRSMINFSDFSDSIMSSSRAVSEVEVDNIFFCFVDENKKDIRSINEDNFEDLLEFLDKFSQSIKKLTFNCCLMTDRNFIDILMTLNEGPLEELNLIKVALFYTGSELYPKNLKLPKLKKLDMTGTNFGHIFGTPDDENLVANFFKSLPDYCNIEKFVALPTLFNLMPLDKFYLNSLGIHKNAPFRTRISTIICRQYRLKELDLTSTFIMDDVLMEIINLPSIESLKINCQSISIREFSKICIIPTLNELHLEIGAKQTWVPNALINFPFANISKLSVDLWRMSISAEVLRDIFKVRIKELHVKTSQKCVLQSVFTSQCGNSLEVLTVELYFDYSNAKRFSRGKLHDIRQDFPNLKSLTIINKIPELAGCTNELATLLQRFKNLQKIHIEGFFVNGNLHSSSLINAKHTIEEIILIDLHNQPGYEPDYVIPPQSEKPTRECIKLKKLIITCIANYFFNYAKFPVIKRVEKELIFCHR